MRKNGEVISPQLQAEWHPTKNAATFTGYPTRYSKRKAWWRCHFGHSWQATPQARGKGSPCPYCAGKLLLPGFNDLATVNPALAREWHGERNDGDATTIYHLESRRKAWWICSLGHSWEATPYTRRDRGCPYCCNRYVLPGYNDLLTTHGDLARQWHPGNALSPQEITAGSNRSIAWLCPLGHSYHCTPSARINRGRGCPYCSGQKVLEGYNDLATINPSLAEEWHPTKNEMSPREVTAGSSRTAWWLCSRGHEWRALIGSRARGRGCPSCPSQHSREEAIVREALLPDATPALLPIPFRSRGYCLVDGVLDDIVLEYDGSYWHRDSMERDVEKTMALLSAGYKVIRVRLSLPSLSIHYERYLEVFLEDLSPNGLATARRAVEDWTYSPLFDTMAGNSSP